MFESFVLFLNNWNAKYGERQKLQQLYLAIIAVVTVLAGLVSLVRPRLGHNIMYIVGAALVAFLVNAIAWHLLHSAVLLKLGSTARKRRS
ncbi:MAG TPA: hypothetical protein VLG11_04710 [Candidatus Saccharimonadales bacterium]|nr:hypothetical protein [Candidatus Saccharimonadales bacterium]